MYLSFYNYLPSSFSLSLSLSLSLSNPLPPPSLFPTLTHSLYIYSFVYLYFSMYLLHNIYTYRHIALSIYLALSIFLCLPLYLYLSIYVSLSIFHLLFLLCRARHCWVPVRAAAVRWPTSQDNLDVAVHKELLIINVDILADKIRNVIHADWYKSDLDQISLEKNNRIRETGPLLKKQFW